MATSCAESPQSPGPPEGWGWAGPNGFDHSDTLVIEPGGRGVLNGKCSRTIISNDGGVVTIVWERD